MNSDDVHLDQIRIAAPCPIEFDELEGDGPVRRCRLCNLNVYDFSNMSRDEIARVVHEHEGRRLCAQFYRRADGTMLLRDCPVGLRALRVRMLRAYSRVAVVLMMLVAGTISLVRPVRGVNALRTFEPFASLCERIAPTAPPPVWRGQIARGRVLTPQNPGICFDEPGR